LGVPEEARERWIGEPQVSVEAGDAQRIKCQVEELYQLVVDRLGRLTHAP
jgi:hypothetical protein